VSVRLAAATTAVVALAAAILSWDALSWAARQSGVDPRLAWLWPVAVDGAIATGTVAAVALRSARLRVRTWAWCVLGGGVAVSLVGNGAHATGGSPLHRVAAAVPAVALAASLHLLTVLVRHVGANAPARSSAMAAPAPGFGPTPPARQRRASGSDRDRRLARLLARHPNATAAEVALALGVSRRTAQRLLAEARRPRVVGELVERPSGAEDLG
jgi:hypothetical protein